MKKFFKGIMTLAIAFVCVFAFAACKDPISATSVDTSRVGLSNGQSTNGGITAIYNGYLYFINGTKTNDGTSSTGNKRGAICRVKYNSETGKVDENTYEIVVDDLAGFSNGSLYFFGDFMYYTTPSSDVNYKDNVLYYKTKFMRYDLVNKKSYNIYTTKQNSSSESINYAYYVVGNSLNLLVFEKANASLTSINISENPTTNYVISGVTSCVMSENNGKVVTAGASADANSFVFYTKANEEFDKYQTGVKVFRTSPTTNNSVCLSSKGLSISLLCIRSGKLLYSLESKIYAEQIDASTTELKTEDFKNIISYNTYDDVVFIENDDGSVTLLYFESKNNYQIVIVTWNYSNGIQIENKTICALSKFTDFSFINLVTLEEEVKVNENTEGGESTTAEGEEDKPSEDEPENTVRRKVTYITYVADKYAYKLEVMRENENGEMEVSVNSKPVKLSTTKVQDVNGTLIPEVVGNYLYIYVNELDKSSKETGHVYMYRLDLTLKSDATSSNKAEHIGIKEDSEK